MTESIKNARILRSEFSPHWGRMAGFQWGKIGAVHLTGTPTVDVYLDGSTVLTTGVYYLATYFPKVNDIVVIGRMVGPAQTARFVIGPLASHPTAREETIDEKVCTGNTASVTFPNQNSTIGGYRHLKCIYYGRNNNAGTGSVTTNMQFNTDTGGNYDYVDSFTHATNSLSAADAFAQTSLIMGVTSANGSVATTADGGVIFIENYAGTTFHKICHFDGGQKDANTAGNIYLRKNWGVWRSTAAITSIKLFPGADSFLAGSTFTLVGIPGLS